MGEARARALQAWQSLAKYDGSTPPNRILQRWREAHPKGRGFSCYQRDFKVSLQQITHMLQQRGQAMLNAAVAERESQKTQARKIIVPGERRGLTGALAALMAGGGVGGRRGA